MPLVMAISMCIPVLGQDELFVKFSRFWLYLDWVRSENALNNWSPAPIVQCYAPGYTAQRWERLLGGSG